MLAFNIDIIVGIITVGEIKNWFIINDNHLQNMLMGSQIYANIEFITEMEITYKMIEVSGCGFVVLNNPKQHPNIFCPEVD